MLELGILPATDQSVGHHRKKATRDREVKTLQVLYLRIDREGQTLSSEKRVPQLSIASSNFGFPC